MKMKGTGAANVIEFSKPKTSELLASKARQTLEHYQQNYRG
jgi:hypothetical protein